jgi:L-ascorbate metabolism protein UlaG (beta-lactamase superfamily)
VRPRTLKTAFRLDKSSIAGRPRVKAAPPEETLSRRRWLAAGLGAGTAALAGEFASLDGTFDHRSPAPLTRLPVVPVPIGSGEPRLTHIGHSCHLLELSGQRWLTDPWFFNPAFGSLSHAIGLPIESVGPLDGIFISHRHADHFDPTALRHLDKKAQVWTADPSLLPVLLELGFARVQLSQPWQTEAAQALEISFVPAVHDVPQHSLILAGRDARVLFAGDTGPHDHWGEIRRRYRPTTALLPSDGTSVRWEPRQIMDPREAAAAAVALGCAEVFATHADASYVDPVAQHLLSTTEKSPLIDFEEALAAAAAETGPIRAPALAVLELGETRRLFS